ncbi:MAG: hypothetical protein R2831_02215 [Chitinophagaceae bacterium]
MSIKYTPAFLKKFESLFEEIGYTIRYEKGNFHSGYCILKERRIAVINKFLTLEGRINSLIDILPEIVIDTNILSHEGQAFYDMVMLTFSDK